MQIKESDLQEKFVRSQGQGGQNVNKVATCVYLRHRPSGIAVKCQETRQQLTNRYLARRMILEKIQQRQQERERRLIAQREKDRRRRRRRSKESKEKMLEKKKMNG